MTTSLTEKQLTDIKLSLENSLVLVKRGLTHMSAANKHTDFTPQVQASLDNPESIYYKYPQFLFHFQMLDVIIELHFHKGIYCCYVCNWIPSDLHLPFTDIHHYNLGSAVEYPVSNLSEARLAPSSFYESIRLNCYYGKCENFESGQKLFSSLLYDFFNVSELPF